MLKAPFFSISKQWNLLRRLMLIEKSEFGRNGGKCIWTTWKYNTLIDIARWARVQFSRNMKLKKMRWQRKNGERYKKDHRYDHNKTSKLLAKNGVGNATKWERANDKMTKKSGPERARVQRIKEKSVSFETTRKLPHEFSLIQLQDKPDIFNISIG